MAGSPYQDPRGRALLEWLLDGELHPGGARLSETLLDQACLAPSERVVEVGCGNGGLAARVAARGGVWLGVDPSVASGNGTVGGRLCALGLPLPLRDRSVDVVVAECALCLAGDWHPVLAEARRVLRPGGRLAFHDFVRASQAPWADARWARHACLDRAGPQTALEDHLEDAGFDDVAVLDATWALREIEDRVTSKVDLMGLVGTVAAATPGTDAPRLVALLEQARNERDAGLLRYVVVVATA